MPRYLGPFVAIVVTTWLGGIVSGFALVGGPEWATPTATVTPPSITPSQGISGAVVSPTPLPPGASGSTAPEATGPPPTVSQTVSPSLVAPSGTARTATPTVRPTRAPSAPPTAPPSTSIPTPAPTVPPTLEPTLEPSIPPITPPPTLPPTLPPSVAVSCGNGVDNSGGLGLICEVTIGAESATIRECHGAAGDPQAACSIRTIAGRVTSVDICNGSANGGGATMRCSVTGVGLGSAPVTLCVGSGAGGTLVGMTCTWSGSSAVPVNMCNGSANGGGALLICLVES